MAKVLISVNTTWNLVNFRSGLLTALTKSGHEVVAVAPPDDYVEALRALGCQYIPIAIDNKGTNPVKDSFLLVRYILLLRRERPDIFLGFTIKPNIYGSLACRLVSVPVVNNISGLGTAFLRNSALNLMVRFLYRISLSRSFRVLFQNPDDRHLFLESRIVSEVQAGLLPGSGVDLNFFPATPLPNRTLIRFLFLGRVLWDKGVGEFVEAARELTKQGIEAEFCILGPVVANNRSAISRAQLARWVDGGVIRYLGSSEDVRSAIRDADCIVLPSYREGTPRSLLEAAAMGRPVIAADVPGCREAVIDQQTGFLCRERDHMDLARKMREFSRLPQGKRESMGRGGRKLVEKNFDEKIVTEKYIRVLREAVTE